MPIAEIYGGISAFKSMFDIAKGLKDMSNTAERNGAVIELQEKILAARDAQTLLLGRVGELEKEVAKFETWEAEKQRYKLNKLPPGVMVRTLKPEMANSEPAHHICENCYQNNKKSPLHQSEVRNGVYHLKCNGCGAELRVGNFIPPQVRTARGIGGDGGPDDWMR